MFLRLNFSTSKDSIAFLLMIISLVLLIVLQLLWLTASWREERENFRKETNILFRNTIFDMQDSVMARNIEPVPGDTLLRSRRFFLGDSAQSFFGVDTVADHLKLRETSVVQVLITRQNDDSISHFLPPLARRIKRDKKNRRFLIHLGPDSLSTDSITAQFAQVLSSSGIAVPFTVERIGHRVPGRPESAEGVIVSEVVALSPMDQYAVHFSSVNRMFLKRILPEILFSFFIVLVTAGSFYLMRVSMRSQKKLMDIKNDLISNISHELKTPVSTVSVALEALERFKGLDDPQKTTEYLSMAKNELQRLTLMTDKILQAASFENKQPQMNMKMLDMDLQVGKVLDSLRFIFRQRNIEVQFERLGTDFQLEGNLDHLVTVIYNLLDNAIKYSPAPCTISIKLVDRSNEIAFSVKDNGMGIPPAYHAKVFEKFFRVPGGDVHNIKGYGLGLSYVANVVDQHRGKIRLESGAGTGSCFTLYLPKRQTG